MKIIIAPAKRMTMDIPYIDAKQYPVFIKDAQKIMRLMKKKSKRELQTILGCSENIACEALDMFKHMEVYQGGVPAILAYQGIQYTYMAPQVFPDEYYAYVEKHLRILSGFYGILKPFDAVVPYRLELNNKLYVKDKNLYEYWNQRVYNELIKEDCDILDLASVQYSKIIQPYCDEHVHYVKCSFYEYEKNMYREKGVYVKMARGEMVRYLAEVNAQSFQDVKGFQRLGYRFQESLSNVNHLVFVRKANRH